MSKCVDYFESNKMSNCSDRLKFQALEENSRDLLSLVNYFIFTAPFMFSERMGTATNDRHARIWKGILLAQQTLPK